MLASIMRTTWMISVFVFALIVLVIGYSPASNAQNLGCQCQAFCDIEEGDCNGSYGNNDDNDNEDCVRRTISVLDAPTDSLSECEAEAGLRCTGSINLVTCFPITAPDPGCNCDGFCTDEDGNSTLRLRGRSDSPDSCEVDSKSACLEAREEFESASCTSS